MILDVAVLVAVRVAVTVAFGAVLGFVIVTVNLRDASGVVVFDGVEVVSNTSVAVAVTFSIADSDSLDAVWVGSEVSLLPVSDVATASITVVGIFVCDSRAWATFVATESACVIST